MPYSLIMTDLETGRVLPVIRATIDIGQNTSLEPIIATVQLVVTEVELEALAEIERKRV